MTRISGWVRRVPALACAVATLALAAACGGGDDEPEEGSPSSTTTTAPSDPTTTSPPTTALTAEEEAKAVYLEFVDTVTRLGTTDPNPDDPELARLASDPVLGDVRDSLTTQRAENQVWQVGNRTSHEVLSTTLDGASTAVLIACAVENDTLIDRDDGSVVRTVPLATRTLEVTVTRFTGRWTVSDVATRKRVDGEVPCDA
jgi:hypothetical protein